LHTRFDHSLGTLHMAARRVQAIRDNAHRWSTRGRAPLRSNEEDEP
jgi:HD superfamily phosphohydrolase